MSFFRDVRYGLRSLTRRQSLPFTMAALLTLALGIGAVTAIFTVVHAVLLAPLPYREPDRVVRVMDTNPAKGIEEFSASMLNFRSVQERARSFSSLVAMRGADANLTGGGDPSRVKGLAVLADFFSTLGIAPIAGRGFAHDDDGQAKARVVMISDGLWTRRYGRSPSAIGSTIDVNLVPHVVIGVAPQDAGFSSAIDVWLPLGRVPETDDNRGDRRLTVLGRLAPGVSVAQANDELQRIALQLEAEFPEANRDWRLRITPIREWIVAGDVSVRLRILLAAVVLLLLVASTNVANLQIARASARLREIGVRLALGATRGRIVRQMLAENVLLAVTGGLIGLGLAWAVLRSASAILAGSLPRAQSLTIDLPVLLAAAAAVGFTAILTGLLPAMIAVQSSVQHTLQQAGRATTGSRAPARQALVAVQLALATTLVICAGLLAQSLMRLQGVTLGFDDPDRLLTTQITRSVSSDDMLDRNAAFFASVLDEIRGLPGVVSAGLSNDAPFGTADTGMSVTALPGDVGVQASWRIASSDYLKTLQVPIRQGRAFAARDEPRRSIILSDGLARRLWPSSEDVVGRSVRLGNGQTFSVVGVAGDVRQVTLAGGPTPTMYLPTSWYLWPTMTLVVRTDADPATLTQPIRQAVARVDPRQPLSAFRTLGTAVTDSAAAPRLHAIVLGAFAVLALLLAGVGVAGVVSYGVGQRTHELAVRLAMGATPGQVVRLVMRGGLLAAAAGITCGVAAALALGQTLSSVLFGVSASDPITLVVAVAALLAIAAFACWLPARRATRVSFAELLIR